VSSIYAAFFLLLVAVAQATVAPRYPLSAAFPDYMLVTLVVWATVRPRDDSMVALPLGAFMVGATGPQSVMVLMFLYLTLLPGFPQQPRAADGGHPVTRPGARGRGSL
jgi:hypothetical protein